MSIIITTEATSDYPGTLAREDLKIIPMGYTVNGVAYDGITEKLTPHEFYDAVRKAKTKEDLPQTTMVTAYQLTEFLDPLLAEGNDIIHIVFSHALSGTYDQSQIALKDLKAKYPERKIAFIDSLSACFGEGIIAYYVALKKDTGASFEELVDYATEIRHNSNAIFVIDDLNHLCRTGRASRSEAYLGTAFHIKPILYIPDDGSLQPFTKAISQKKTIKTMIEVFDKKAWKGDKDVLIGIGNADAPEDGEFLINQVKALGYKNIVSFDVGPVIGTHVGAGMLVIIYMADNRNL